MPRTYDEKRDFTKTSEPQFGSEGTRPSALTFVVQRHEASHIHFDFRLECDGALKSWAVPKGPSMNPKVRHAAIMVEDHPLEYANFEGQIPKGQYGGGEVILWDEGTYAPEGGTGDRKTDEKLVREALKEGKLNFVMAGSRLKGGFVLVRTRDSENWLLIKRHDEFESTEEPTKDETSVRSGLTAEDLRQGKKTRIWNSNRPKTDTTLKEKDSANKPTNHSPQKHIPFGLMVPTEVEKPFDSDEWTFEPKLDGVRALAIKEGPTIRLITRNDKDIAHRFPGVVDDVRALPEENIVLDGELVMVGPDGKPNFQDLMAAYHGETIKGGILSFFVFDILAKEDDLRNAPLSERRAVLDKLDLKGTLRPLISTSENGKTLYDEALKLGFEGIVGKRLDSPYTTGRTDEWVKVKAYHSEEFLVCGYTKGTGARSKTFGALVLGRQEKDGSYKYCGNCGGGFSEEQLNGIRAQLDELRTGKSMFDPETEIPGKPVFVKPELLAEVRFMAWTRDGKLRFPIFLRLREDLMDQTPKAEITHNLTTGKDTDEIQVDGHEIQFTHLSKELWPGLTKRDLVTYLLAVGDVYLSYLKDRPLTFVRYPDGIEGEGFFQRHWEHGLPGFVETVEIYSKSNSGTRRHLMCNNMATLLWLGQISALELHPWHSRVVGEGLSSEFNTQKKLESSALEYPDYLVCDLDPNIRSGKEKEGAEPELNEEGWRRTVEVALGLKEMLDSLKMHAYVKTTGKTGLHIYIPLVREYESDQVKEAARVLGSHLMDRMKGKITMELRLNKRPNLVFFDANMNGRGRTLASAYSPRPVPGGRASMPLAWDLLEKSHPEDFTIQTIPDLLKDRGDAWAGFLEDRQRLS